MTDITDKDKREARKWAEQTIANRVNSPTDPWVIAARLFLANEEPPAPTLAEELREWAEKRYSGVVGTGKHELLALATRAEQIEKELYEARMLAKDEADLYNEVREERDTARAEVERLTAEQEANVAPDQQANSLKTPNSSFKSSLKESAQNPADVPSGEPWIV